MGSLQVHKYPPCLRGQLIRSKGQRHVVICDIDCFAVTLPPLSTQMFDFLIWLLFLIEEELLNMTTVVD